MKTVIEKQNNPNPGYIVSTKDGLKIKAKTIDEAIKIKFDLMNK